MVARPRQLATYADLMRVPDTLVAELIDGELFTSPRPAGAHTRATSRLGFVLGPPFDFGEGGPGGWWILDEPELHLGPNVLVPDLAGWRRERMSEPPHDHVFDIPPDWICEVTSPSSGRLDRLKKMPVYAREAVGFAWLLDPLQQTLESYERQDDRWVLLGTFGGEPLARIRPFEAIEIDLTRIFGALPS
jgi:Uma2 family endonuclease